MNEPMDRAEAERILAAQGWRLCDQRGSQVLVEYQDGHLGELHTRVLRALDLDQPPSLAALRRLVRGFAKLMGTAKLPQPFFDEHPLNAVLSLETNMAGTLIAEAWKLGGEPKQP